MPLTPRPPVATGPHTITGVPTSITAFIGRAAEGPVNQPVLIESAADYKRIFGGLVADSTMSYAVNDFYANGGSQAIIIRLTAGAPPFPAHTFENPAVGHATGGSEGAGLTAEEYLGDPDAHTGIYALDGADLFNLLCIPPPRRGADTPAIVYSTAAAYCVKHRAMLLMDPPEAWGACPETAAGQVISGLPAIAPDSTDARNTALYFPLIVKPDPNRELQLDRFVPCGAVAGIMASNDRQRGVWTAPAGAHATLNGTAALQVDLKDPEIAELNRLGVNCLRSFPISGPVVWGARTLHPAGQPDGEQQYIPVRRLMLFLEESLYRGTQWVVFEPNAAPLWSQIRLNIQAFLQDLFQKGAFQGASARDAYFVECDSATTTESDIENGIVNIVVGFALSNRPNSLSFESSNSRARDHKTDTLVPHQDNDTPLVLVL